jgi:glutaredoxin
METETIIGIQIFTFLGYVGTVFGLYRILVNQKDATIEMLQTQCELLKGNLEAAEKNEPDNLIQRLENRKNILERELISLGHESDKKRIELQAEINELSTKKEELENEVLYVNSILEKYSCPHCSSTLLDKGYAVEAVESDDGKEYDIEHEWASFECGYKEADGKETSPCLSYRKV